MKKLKNKAVDFFVGGLKKFQKKRTYNVQRERTIADIVKKGKLEKLAKEKATPPPKRATDPKPPLQRTSTAKQTRQEVSREGFDHSKVLPPNVKVTKINKPTTTATKKVAKKTATKKVAKKTATKKVAKKTATKKVAKKKAVKTPVKKAVKTPVKKAVKKTTKPATRPAQSEIDAIEAEAYKRGQESGRIAGQIVGKKAGRSEGAKVAKKALAKSKKALEVGKKAGAKVAKAERDRAYEKGRTVFRRSVRVGRKKATRQIGKGIKSSGKFIAKKAVPTAIVGGSAYYVGRGERQNTQKQLDAMRSEINKLKTPTTTPKVTPVSTPKPKPVSTKPKTKPKVESPNPRTTPQSWKDIARKYGYNI